MRDDEIDNRSQGIGHLLLVAAILERQRNDTFSAVYGIV